MFSRDHQWRRQLAVEYVATPSIDSIADGISSFVNAGISDVVPSVIFEVDNGVEVLADALTILGFFQMEGALACCVGRCGCRGRCGL